MNIDRPKIVLLYQSLLGIYGDHGNAVVLTLNDCNGVASTPSSSSSSLVSLCPPTGPFTC